MSGSFLTYREMGLSSGFTVDHTQPIYNEFLLIQVNLFVGFTEFPSHKLMSWFDVKCCLTVLLFTPFFYCIE